MLGSMVADSSNKGLDLILTTNIILTAREQPLLNRNGEIHLIFQGTYMPNYTAFSRTFLMWIS